MQHTTCKSTNRTNVVIIPNRTFLVRFGGISGEFGRAINEPDMPPKCTKKVRLGIYRIQIQPKIR